MVTGGAGFLGQAVVRRLRDCGANDLYIPRSHDHDLRTSAGVEAAMDEGSPRVLLHLAGVTAGIGAMRKRPGTYFYDNAIMGIQLMEAARQRGVEKFVTIGTV